MIIIKFLYILVLYRILYAIKLKEEISPVVAVNDGHVCGLKYTGFIDGKVVYTFKGIPYAKPPVGNLRFRKTEPQHITLHEHCRKDNKIFTYKPGCVQPFNKLLGVSKTSEDCLHLNIWTPTLSNSNLKPVLFWIHGGGFFVGSSDNDYNILRLLSDSSKNYDGTQLALKDVVVVTINYRLGVFGYLYDDSEEAPGNAGLWDQVYALNWTKENIRYFGGDPDNIVLFGESAGSISISLLIVSNIDKYEVGNLFNKAILFSGSGYNDVFTPSYDYGSNLTKSFSKFVGCPNDRSVECLRAMNPYYLSYMEIDHMNKKGEKFHKPLHFTPIYGDIHRLIPTKPKIALEEGYFINKNLTLLMNHNEMEGVFMSKVIKIEKMVSFLAKIIGIFMKTDKFYELLDEISLHFKLYNDYDSDYNVWIEKKLTKVLNRYLPTTFASAIATLYIGHLKWYKTYEEAQIVRYAFMHSLGDYFFTCPTVLFGAKLTQHPTFNGKVFQTRFTYLDPDTGSLYGKESLATHGQDLKYIFGIPKGVKANYDQTNLSDSIMELITNFARSGQEYILNPLEYKDWPPYQVKNNKVIASYIELNPDPKLLGKIYTNRYRGKDGFKSYIINNCFVWDYYF